MKQQKEIYGIIYMIRNRINNKLYIGQTTEEKGFCGRYHFSGTGVERVYRYNINNKKYGVSYNKHLIHSIEKYGFDAFEVDEEFDVAYSKEELDKLEDMYIKIYDCIANGYNNKEGGSNGKHSDKTKEKISQSKMGHNVSKETRIKLKEINLGKTVSKETREKMSKSFKGRKHTEESKKKMSEVQKGRKHTEETKKKMSEAKKGKALSEEHKQKLKDSHKREGDHPNSKAVYCYEFNDIRLSIREWSKELDISSNMINSCCRGNKKSASNFHFRYATKEEIEKYDPLNNIEITEKDILLIKFKKAIYCEERKEIRVKNKDWADELGLDNSHISSCCKGKRESTGGYHFRYATEEEIEEYIDSILLEKRA